MTIIGIRYLTGYAAASNLAGGTPEWPPHPARIFMAMAAAHFDTKGPDAERQALLWLESQPAPAMQASNALPRTTVEAYVPVNDAAGAIANRSRQPRTFSKARPDNDTVYLLWQQAPPDELKPALAALCAKVTRVGHSSSLTQLWLEENSQPSPNWIPEDSLEAHRLRVPAPGTLSLLENAYGAARISEYLSLQQELESAPKSAQSKIRKKIKEAFPLGEPKSERPSIATWSSYSPSKAKHQPATAIGGPFDADFIVLTVEEGPALGLESTIQLTGALRNAAMKAAGENPPEWLTGHTSDSRPSREPHLAFFPLPFVGAQYADGHILGLGIAIPRALTNTNAKKQELRHRLGPLFFDPNSGAPRRIELWNKNSAWRWTLDREQREQPPRALQRSRWTRPSRRWASATPVVLHHHPKKRDGHAEQILSDAFASALLPRPAAIRLTPASVLTGSPSAPEMPLFTEGGANLCRYHCHAEIWFSEPVQGPILVGRGRYRGYGLFAPLDEDKE